MSRNRLWLALAILLPALAATIAPMSTVDLAYQVRAGELMLGSLAILRTDPFTFTAFGEPWLNQQWGAGVLFAIVHGIAGWGGLVVLRVVLVAASVGLVALAARRWLAPRTAVLLALAGFVVGIAALGLRAQLFGILVFAAVLAILAWRESRPRLVWAIPVLILAWANLHGSFFLGPAAVAVALLEDLPSRRTQARRLLVVLGLSLAATCVTPFGPAVWGYALGIATNDQVTRLITEWQRTSPFTVTGALFYASVIGAIVVVVRAVRGRDVPLPVLTVVWLGALALLGAYAERGVAWWAFGAPVALAPVVASLAAPGGAQVRAPREDSRPLRLLNGALAGVLALAVVALQPLWRPADSLTGPEGLLRDAPGGLASALAAAADSTDRVVAPQPWASWFEWSAPDRLVMVDSRVEVVPAWAWADYATIVVGGPAALETLDQIAATVVVVDPEEQSALDITLRGFDAGWRLSYEDDDGVLFTRVE